MDDVDGVRLERAGMRASVVSAVFLFAMSKGLALADLHRATGLTLDDLVDPERRLPDKALAQTWALLAARFPGEPIALDMAAAAPLAVFGPLAQATRFAPTRRDVLTTFRRYDKVLSGGLDIRLVENAGETLLVLSHHLDAIDGGHGAEAAVALGVRLCEEVLGIQPSRGSIQDGDRALVRVDLAHPPNAPAEQYNQRLGLPVRFEQGRSGLVFDSSALDQPPLQPNPQMYRHIAAHLDLVQQQLLAHVDDEPLDRVRAAISALAQRSEYGAEAVARRLGMSVRTLQRHVAQHGSSLRTLIEETREANARRLLSDPRLSVDEVAFLVGYSDDRAFRRAFKRWTGLTPAAFRP